MYSQLIKQYAQSKDENLVDKTIELFKEDQAKKDASLYEFIDDFIQSEEYAEYLRKKQEIVETYVDPAKMKSLHPSEQHLATKYHKIRSFENQLNRFSEKTDNEETIRKQERGIKLIKDKIAEFKHLYLRTHEKNIKRNQNLRKNLFIKFCQENNINYKHLSLKSRDSITDKVVYYAKLKKCRKEKKELNYLKIICKLTQELEYNTPKKPLKKPQLKLMETSSKESEDEEYVDAEPETTPKITSQLTESQQSTHIDVSPVISCPWDQPARYSVMGSICDILTPNVKEQTLKRSKSKSLLTGLLKEFEEFEEFLENQKMLLDSGSSGAPLCHNLKPFPKEVVFENIQLGKVYKKKLTIFNTTKETYKLRLLRIDIPGPDAFHIKPLPEIFKLHGGNYINLFLIFKPKVEFSLKGLLKFMTHRLGSLSHRELEVPVYCLEKFLDIRIPKTINFGSLSYWKAELNPFKVLQVTNEGKLDCDLVLKRCKPECPETEPEVESESEVETVEPIIDKLLDNIFDAFRLERDKIHLGGYETVAIKIFLHNVHHIGDYFEKYIIDVFKGEHTARESIIVTAEVTENFLKFEPEVVDFGVCFYDTLYQTCVDLCNNSNSIQTVCVKLPSSLLDYVKCDVSLIYVPARSSKRVWLKFLPRASLITSNYYSESSSVIRFSVFVSIPSKPDVPQIKSTLLAVLSERLDLSVTPLETNFVRDNTIDLGRVSIFDTVYTTVEVRNTSLQAQIYYFTNVPECLTLVPDFGFGELSPGESKIYTVYFHPGLNDLEKGCFDEQTKMYVLNVETLSNLGRFKSKFDVNKLKNSVSVMLREMKRPTDLTLFELMEECKSAMRLSLNDIRTEPRSGDELKVTSPEKSFKNNSQIKLQATITRPLLELSCNEIYLPSTACCSYSSFELKLSAVDYPELSQYEAFFRIFGNTSEIKIEPNCGILNPGETKKLYVIARPNIPKEISTGLNDVKRNYVEKRESKKKIETKRKKPKRVKSLATRHDSFVDDLDSYPTEMFVWRNLEPYYLRADFVCKIRYSDLNLNKKTDTLYLKATCKVSQPDFITPSPSQILDFGTVALGMSTKQTFMIQNISYDTLKPKINLLSPLGPFRIPPLKNPAVPSENFLTIPMTFTPRQENTFNEYIEISSSKTKMTLMLKGVGVSVVPETSPMFDVYREDTMANSVASYKLLINNNGDVDITINVYKLFESCGRFKFPSPEIDSKQDKSGKHAPIKKREIVLDRFSEELTNFEQESIKDSFVKLTDNEFFYVIDEQRVVERQSSYNVNILFGKDNVVKKMIQELKGRKRKGQQVKQRGSIRVNEDKIYYVAKFAVMLGDLFLRDIICIGSFK